MTKKNLLCTIAFAFLLASCNKEINPNLITANSIGLLTDSTQVKDLESIFSNDSIVRYIGGDEFTGRINDIDVYARTGELLLTLSPSEALDSTATVKTIAVKDLRYQTSKGITINSTFGELQKQYKISRIHTTFNNVVVLVNEINASFVISKQELPENLRHDTTMKIEAVQIPETAKIKDFNLFW